MGLLFGWPAFVSPGESGHPLAIWAMRGIFGALGGLAFYWGLAELANTTVIKVGPLCLSVHQGPIPWPGMAEVPLAQVLGARVGSQVYESETLFFVYLVAGAKEVPAFPGFGERQDADRIASAVNAAIAEVRQAHAPTTSGTLTTL